MTTIPMSSSHSSQSSHVAIDWAALAKKVPLAVALGALLLTVVMTRGGRAEGQCRELLRRAGLNRWSTRRTFLWRGENLES